MATAIFVVQCVADMISRTPKANDTAAFSTIEAATEFRNMVEKRYAAVFIREVALDREG